MTETALYNSLEKYNENIENNFKSNWGSLLTFLDGKDTDILTYQSKTDQMVR